MASHAAARRSRKTSDKREPSPSANAQQEQVNLRLSREVCAWLTQRAGGRRGVPTLIRALIERERAAERDRELRAMFDRAAEDLTEEDREERRLFMRAHPNRD